MEKLNDFKKELAELLGKYGATIACDICQFGGIDKMVVGFGASDKWKEYTLCNGVELSTHDIKIVKDGK